MDTKVVKLINKYRDNFVIISAAGGWWGSVVYRCIAGSDDTFVWHPKLAHSPADEKLLPLEWPHKTEGFNTYLYDDNSSYIHFKAHQLTASHLGILNLEYMNIHQLLEWFNPSNKLILKTHDLNAFKYFKGVKIVRVFGDANIMSIKTNRLRIDNSENPPLAPLDNIDIFNLNISKFLNKDYLSFETEYLRLCEYLKCNINISNVRSYILNVRERHERF